MTAPSELLRAVETFIDAYRKRYQRPVTGGIPGNAPMRMEVADLNNAYHKAIAKQEGAE